MVSTIFVLLLSLAFFSGFFFLWRLPLIQHVDRDLKKDSKLSVIIPARNEQKSLPRLLKSLNDQVLPQLEVIVVDDESTDQTVAIAKEHHARVLSVNDEQKTVSGKSGACWLGAQAASGDYLLFMDADTWCVHNHALKDVLHTYRTDGDTGLLSVQPYHVIKSFYETASIVFNIVVLTGLNRFTWLKEKLPQRGAFGPFILVKREEYFSVGGHGEIVDSHMDGIELAKNYHSEDYPATVFGGKHTIHFRMHPEGLTQLIEGWTKSSVHGAEGTHPLVMGSLGLWITGHFAVPAGIILSLFTGNLWLLAVNGVFYVLLSIQFRWLMNKVGRFPVWTMLFPVIYICAFLLITLWGVIQVYILKRVKWRGREYKA